MSKVSRVSEPDLGRLLSGRNEPSVLEKEAALELVLAEVAPARRRWPWGGRVGAVALPLIAAAAAFALFWPGDASHELGSADPFASRGGGAPATDADMVVRCVAGTAADEPGAACAPGAVLGFAVSPPEGKLNFSAFAMGGDGELLWYFPTPNGQSLALSDASSAASTRATVKQVVPKGIPLGPEHKPGTYEVYGVFSSVPLSRAHLREILGPELAGRVDSKNGLTVSVVHRTFEVGQ